MQEELRGDSFTVVGVATDIQGAAAARPWYEKQPLTYPTLVDTGNALGRVIGYTAIPNQFYIDELGMFHGHVEKDRLRELLARPLQPVPTDLAARFKAAAMHADPAGLMKRANDSPGDFDAQLAAGRAALHADQLADAIAVLSRAARLRGASAEAWTLLARAHLATGDKPAAAEALRKGLEADPKNWIIHKQIWAIEHPERFYEGPVDFGWQREQLRREAGDGS
jgi:tetratricopeptide (TPR) repeat protein